MDGFVDLDGAIKAEAKRRVDRIEKLAGLSALIMLSAATWLAWPSLESAISGGSMTSDLKYAMIIIAWGVFVQDLGVMDKKARSRIGTVATISWLPIVIISVDYLEGNVSQIIGMLILLGVSSGGIKNDSTTSMYAISSG